MCCNVGLSWWIPRSAFPKWLGTVIGWEFSTEVSELHHKIWLIESSPVLYSVTKHLEAKVGEVDEVLPEEKCRNSRIYAYCISWQWSDRSIVLVETAKEKLYVLTAFQGSARSHIFLRVPWVRRNGWWSQMAVFLLQVYWVPGSRLVRLNWRFACFAGWHICGGSWSHYIKRRPHLFVADCWSGYCRTWCLPD